MDRGLSTLAAVTVCATLSHWQPRARTTVASSTIGCEPGATAAGPLGGDLRDPGNDMAS